jgi:hypothetical protein
VQHAAHHDRTVTDQFDLVVYERVHAAQGVLEVEVVEAVAERTVAERPDVTQLHRDQIGSVRNDRLRRGQRNVTVPLRCGLPRAASRTSSSQPASLRADRIATVDGTNTGVLNVMSTV